MRRRGLPTVIRAAAYVRGANRLLRRMPSWLFFLENGVSHSSKALVFFLIPSVATTIGYRETIKIDEDALIEVPLFLIRFLR